MKLLALLLPLLYLLSTASAQTPEGKIPTILQSKELPAVGDNAKRFIWRTDPGVRYQLWESSDLNQWSPVAGFPRLAEGLADYHDYQLGEGQKKFFQAELIDEQAPKIVNRYPDVDSFAIPRFADIQVQLDDVTGVDASSLILSVGSHSGITVADSNASFSNGLFTYDVIDTALGNAGETVEASLQVSDTLGNQTTHHWSFTLALDPTLKVSENDVFVFGSADAQRTGQRLSANHRKLSNAIVGAVRLPANASAPFELSEILPDRLILTLTGSASPSFAVNQVVCNTLPLNESEIFYRRITSINSAGATLTLFTDEITSLKELIENGDIALSESSRLINEDGTSASYQPAIGFDLGFTGIDLGINLFEDDELLSIALSGDNGTTDESARLSIKDINCDLDPFIRSSASIRDSEITQICSEYGMKLDFELDMEINIEAGLSVDKEVFNRKVVSRAVYIGNIGFLPVFAEVAFRLIGEAEADLTGELQLGLKWNKEQELGFKYCYPNTADSNVSPVSANRGTPEPFFTPGLDFVLGASSKFSVKPQIEFNLYYLAGVAANVHPFVKVSTESSVLTDDAEIGMKWGLGYEIKPSGILLEELELDDSFRIHGTFFESPIFNLSSQNANPLTVDNHLSANTISIFNTPHLGSTINTFLLEGEIPIPGTKNESLINVANIDYQAPLSVIGTYNIEEGESLPVNVVPVIITQITPESITVNGDGETYLIEVTAGGDWDYTVIYGNEHMFDSDWLTVQSTTNGLQVTAPAIPYPGSRTAEIIIDGVVHTVTQSDMVLYPVGLSNKIAAGSSHSLYVKADGSLWAMGDNFRGQIGDSVSVLGSETPIQVDTNVVSVSARGEHSMYLKSDGSVWTMGKNWSGELGDVSYVSRDTPEEVVNNVSFISAGSDHSCWINNSGELFVVGENTFGQLGLGHDWETITPTKVADNVTFVHCGFGNTFFIKGDNTLWGMGSNDDGELGDGTEDNKFTPVQVMTNVKFVTAGTNSTYIIKTDGTLWATGERVDSLNFVQIGGDALSGEARGFHGLFIFDDNTLWGLGDNIKGQLGNGSTSYQSQPVQITSDVVEVSTSVYGHSLFIKSDGTLWGMGSNRDGQLGDGTTISKSAPIQIDTGL